MNYEQLVKALRVKFIAYDVTGNHNSAQLYKDAADAIERITAMHEKAEMDATNLTGKLAQAEADIDRLNLEIDKRIAAEIELSKSLDAANRQLKRLKECNDELREAQTYIDHYGDKWMTSAKDVPTAAYEHGYADGRDEAEAQFPKQGEWKPFDLTWGRSIYSCTVCGESADVPTANGKALYKYCPNCGARMDGGEHDLR